MEPGNVSRQIKVFAAVMASALILAVLGACLGWKRTAAGVIIEGKPGSYRLVRDGRPLFIKGAGGNGSRQLLLEAGANSIRTWGAENLGEVLDQAQKDGLTVTAGIWLEHRGGLNYSDPAAVKRQFEMCRSVVEKYKDHPALLMWSFGNEAEGDGKDPNVWRAINEIASMSKKLDPHHPTMTVIAEIGEDKAQTLHQLCPDIDIIGINSYGGAPSLAERYAKQGGTKPYVLTEFGPLGHWEVGKTKWDAPIEATSTEKAEFYKKSYQGAVLQAKGLCLGSYVFLWGHKQEATATWYGMLLPDGSHLGAVDAMTEFWTGKPRANLVPIIRQLSVSPTDGLKPGQTLAAKLEASDPEGKPLTVKWVFSGEAVERLTAGQSERVPKTHPEAIVSSTSKSAALKLPKEPGAYRLFVYVYDDAGGAAVANVPLWISQ